MGPISLDVLISKIAEIVDLFLASGLGSGAISYLYFAKAIFRLPFAFISQAMNTVILKEYSNNIALFDKEKAKRFFVDGVKSNVFFLAPISIMMYLLAEPLVSLILARGEFSAEDAMNTALALKFYSIGLLGWGLHSLTARIFAARIDVKISMLLNFFMLVTHVVLCFALVSTQLRFAGLALATSISFVLFSIIRIIVLKNRLLNEQIRVEYREMMVTFLKTLVTCVLMAIVIVEARYLFSKIHFESALLKNVVLLVCISFVGIAIYFLASLLMKNTDVFLMKRRLFNGKKKVPLSMLSPFRFLETVQKNPDNFKEDFGYKVNTYLTSGKWEVRNIGIKLIGLFKDKSKVHYLTGFLKAEKSNGFMRRNAMGALRLLNIWNPELKALAFEMLEDNYYEVRVATLHYLTRSCPTAEAQDFLPEVHKKLKRGYVEEKLASLKFIAKLGDIEDLKIVKSYFLNRNSLIREEIIELLYGFYRRNLLSSDEVKEYIGRILITSNNLEAAFKIKSLVRKIYKEME